MRLRSKPSLEWLKDYQKWDEIEVVDLFSDSDDFK